MSKDEKIKEKDDGYAVVEYSQKESKKKRRKRSLLLLLFNIVVIGVIIIVEVLSHRNIEPIGSVLSTWGKNWIYLLALLGIIVVNITALGLRYSTLIYSMTGKRRLKLSFSTAVLGKYYDNVTPFGTGGQPFQIYYLYKKRDIPRGAASAVPLARLMVSLFVWCLFALVLMSVAPDYLESSAHIAVSETVRIVSWFSIVLNLSFPLLFGVLSFFPKFTMKVMAFIIFLLKKLHIVKRKYAVTKKYVHGVREYCKSMRELICKWYFLLPLIVLALMETCINVCIPFFAVVAVAQRRWCESTPQYAMQNSVISSFFLSFAIIAMFITTGHTLS